MTLIKKKKKNVNLRKTQFGVKKKKKMSYAV